jgi:neurofibromin 1
VAQRQFILVSKVLQNLANNTLPGAKEHYMEQLNSFITTNKAALEQFYGKLVSGAQRGKATMSEVPSKAKQRSLAVVHQWLERNLALVEKALLAGDDDDEQGSGQAGKRRHRQEEDDRALVEQLKDVLASLGDDASV